MIALCVARAIVVVAGASDMYEEASRMVRQLLQHERFRVAMKNHLHSTVIYIGTMFSGTDGVQGFLNCMAQAAREEHGFDLNFHWVFSCDKSQTSQDFLCAVWKPTHIFTDAEWLAQETAFCCVSNKHEPVPDCDVLIVGCDCGLRSNLCVGRSQNKDCIETWKKGTGTTFQFMMGYLRRHRPSLLMLENVRNFVGNIADTSSCLADAAAELKRCADDGFHSLVLAQDYGDQQARLRMYAPFWDMQSPFSFDTPLSLCFFKDALNVMKISAPKITSYIMSAHCVAHDPWMIQCRDHVARSRSCPESDKLAEKLFHEAASGPEVPSEQSSHSLSVSRA